VVARTLNTIRYSFGALMALEALLLCIAVFSFGRLGPAFFNPVAFLFALIPVVLGLLVWSFCGKAAIGDADALRAVKLILATIGVLALFGIGTALSPLITILFSAGSFIVISVQPFAAAFDAMAAERASYY